MENNTIYTVETSFGTYRCFLIKNKYENGHVAIQLFGFNGLLATITVNVNGIERFPKNYSCVDTNNCPWAEEFIRTNGLGEHTGITLKSGWCTYPVYEF